MPLPDAALQSKADTILANLVTALTAKQETYRTETVVKQVGVDTKGDPITQSYIRSVYFQGPKTPQTTPADGVKIATEPTVKPGYQDKAWADLSLGAALPATMEVAVRVDQYAAPGGPGWVLSGEVVVAGRTYSRAVNVGVESFRDTRGEWVDVTAAAEGKG